MDLNCHSFWDAEGMRKFVEARGANIDAGVILNLSYPRN